MMAAGRSAEQLERARKNEPQSRAALAKLRRLPANTQCADCTAKSPSWAALPHGVFVCIDCAQVHRHLGRHVSQTKNFQTYLWLPEELDVITKIGNANALRAHPGAPPKLSQGAGFEAKLARARAIYEHKLFGPDFTFLPEHPHPQAASRLQAAHELHDLIDLVEVSQSAPAATLNPATSPDAAKHEAFFADFGL